MFTEVQQAQRDLLNDYAQVERIEELRCEDHEGPVAMRSNPHDTAYGAIASGIAFIDEHEGHNTVLVVRDRRGRKVRVPQG